MSIIENSEPHLLRRSERMSFITRRDQIWAQTAAESYRRAAGEGSYILGWNRLFLALTPQPCSQLEIDGQRLFDGPLPARRMSFAAAGSNVWAYGTDAEAAVVYQNPAIYERVLGESFGRTVASLEPVTAFEDPALADLVQGLVGEIDTARPGESLLVEAMSLAIAVRVARHQFGTPREESAGDGTASFTDPVIRRVFDYVEANIGNPELSLTDLANLAGVTIFHFSRRFKKAVGLSPHQYVLSRRIARAKELIRSSSLSINEVARATGFSSPSAFSIRFRAATGYPPSRYRG